MENFKIRYCNLCLATIPAEKDFLLLKLGAGDDSKHEICNGCSAKLFAAQKFKATCSSTDAIITSYINDVTVLSVDLREICMKERPSGCVSYDVNICRLCMQPKKKLEVKLINKEEVDMILTLIPEMNIFIIKEPVMCKLCLDSLAVHCNLLKKCSEVKQNKWQDPCTSSHAPLVDVPVKIEDDVKLEEDAPGLVKTDCSDTNYKEYERFSKKRSDGNQNYGHPDSSSHVPLDNTPVKIEDDDLKLEDVSGLVETECLDIKYEENENESAIHFPETSAETTSIYKYEKYDHRTDLETYEDSSESEKYKCEHCDYKTRTKENLKRHTSTHKDPSEVQIHKCVLCDYETKDKSHLKSHIMSAHLSDVPVYECHKCNFKSNLKNHFDEHLLSHKDISTFQVSKCKICNYKTKSPRTLRKHALMHEDPFKIQKYQYEKRSYKTKQMSCLKTRTARHKDCSEVHIYECVTCNYETEVKQSFEMHMLMHKDPSEVKMYKCVTCGLDPSEVQMYKCQECAYQTIN